MIKTQVCIVGAGPGGAATALKLHQLNIPCVLVDKAIFPRDKICGDAISGKAVTVLNRIDPTIMDGLEADPEMQVDVWGIRFVAPNRQAVDVPYRIGYDKTKDPKQGFISRRSDFDNLLVRAVKKRDNIALHEGIAIDVFEKTPTGYYLSDKEKKLEVECRLLIVANGAHSWFSKHLAGLEKDEKHHAGAIRAYYRNVSGMHPDNFIELHFLKEITPGYFWIFPLPNGSANVGVGMRSDYVSKRRFNLTKCLPEIIENNPEIKKRFQHAELEGMVTGYGLPLGSKRRNISGDHFMLVGDAAHLIDPLSGEGIGNAIYSGVIAAEQAQQCLLSNDFSAKTMKAFDLRVARVLGAEMDISYKLQLMMARPWLVNWLANRAARNHRLVYTVARMYQDLSLRKQALNPLFWMKFLFKER